MLSAEVVLFVVCAESSVVFAQNEIIGIFIVYYMLSKRLFHIA